MANSNAPLIAGDSDCWGFACISTADRDEPGGTSPRKFESPHTTEVLNDENPRSRILPGRSGSRYAIPISCVTLAFFSNGGDVNLKPGYKLELMPLKADPTVAGAVARGN
jgi:hypothetical protein